MKNTRTLNNPNLREIYLRNNQFTAIPKTITQLKHIRKMDLRGNEIKELPIKLLELIHLGRLDLR